MLKRAYVVVAALAAGCGASATSGADEQIDRARPADDRRLAVVLVVDRSGSMQGPRLSEAQTAIEEAADAMAPADLMAVVAFDSDAEVLVPLGRADANAIDAGIDALEAGGGTNVARGLEGANALLAALAPDVAKHVIVITDGQSPTDGLLELRDGMARRGITISALWIGDEPEQGMLDLIATRDDGRTYRPARGELARAVVADVRFTRVSR
jgi:Ca-activated chloride channel homolog